MSSRLKQVIEYSPCLTPHKHKRSRSKFNPLKQNSVHGNQGNILNLKQFKQEKNLTKSMLDPRHSHFRNAVNTQIVRSNQKQSDPDDFNILLRVSETEENNSKTQQFKGLNNSLKNNSKGNIEAQETLFQLKLKKNEIELARLKTQFMDFQQTVFRQLKQQQTILNEMFISIIQEMHKITTDHSKLELLEDEVKSLKKENSQLKINWKQQNLTNFGYKLQMKSSFDGIMPINQIDKKYNRENRQIVTNCTYNKDIQQYNPSFFKGKEDKEEKGKKTVNINRLLSAVEKLKKGLKSMSDLSVIQEPVTQNIITEPQKL